MKRIASFICSVFIILSFLGAQQNNQQSKKENDCFSFMVTTIAAYNPNKDIFDWDYPYVFPLFGVRYTHTFANFQELQNLSLNINSSLSPIWFNATADLSWKPFPFLTLSASGTLGTSWNFSLGSLDVQSMAIYDAENLEYDNLTPFKTWNYEIFLQALFQYDIGSVLTSGNEHIIFTGSFRTSYVGLTGTENGEFWKYMFVSEQVNGLKYDANATLSYRFKLPVLQAVSFTSRFTGYYSDKFFDEKYSNYDATFCEISLTPSVTAAFGYKDILNLSVPFTSKRNFIDEDSDKADEPFLKSDGRKWLWNGVTLIYTHIF